jgi:hypothetical protein
VCLGPDARGFPDPIVETKSLRSFASLRMTHGTTRNDGGKQRSYCFGAGTVKVVFALPTFSKRS